MFAGNIGTVAAVSVLVGGEAATTAVVIGLADGAVSGIADGAGVGVARKTELLASADRGLSSATNPGPGTGIAVVATAAGICGAGAAGGSD